MRAVLNSPRRGRLSSAVTLDVAAAAVTLLQTLRGYKATRHQVKRNMAVGQGAVQGPRSPPCTHSQDEGKGANGERVRAKLAALCTLATMPASRHEHASLSRRKRCKCNAATSMFQKLRTFLKDKCTQLMARGSARIAFAARSAARPSEAALLKTRLNAAASTVKSYQPHPKDKAAALERKHTRRSHFAKRWQVQRSSLHVPEATNLHQRTKVSG